MMNFVYNNQIECIFVDPVEPVVSQEPAHESFALWDLTAFKEWYLPKFQKARFEVDAMGGRDLDRFSRYAFSFFGATRLNGFSGTGVRFDRGLIARAGYSFNLFGAIRFDLALERARVEDKGPEAKGLDAVRQNFTGAGISGNIIGPWKTVIAGSYGRAMQSDIPDLKGKQEFMVTVLKLF